MTSIHGLEPLSPEEGVELYLEDRKPEVVKSTLHEHRSRLNRFLEFCEENSIDDVNDVTSRTAHQYKVWYGEKVAATMLKFNIRTFRQFLKFGENLNAVPDGVANKVSIPQVDYEARSVKLDEEDAEAILSYFQRYEDASFRHVLIHLLWRTGMRASTVRSLDLDDFHPDDPVGPYLDVNHRPETGTPLK